MSNTRLMMVIDDYDHLTFIHADELKDWLRETKYFYDYLPIAHYPTFLKKGQLVNAKHTESGCIGILDQAANLFIPKWRVKGYGVSLVGTPRIEKALAVAHHEDEEFKREFDEG